MKPDWSTAPEWAMWLVQDSNGVWYYCNIEPEWNGDEWWIEKAKWQKAGESTIIPPKEKRSNASTKEIPLVPSSEERNTGALRALIGGG